MKANIIDRKSGRIIAIIEGDFQITAIDSDRLNAVSETCCPPSDGLVHADGYGYRVCMMEGCEEEAADPDLDCPRCGRNRCNACTVSDGGREYACDSCSPSGSASGCYRCGDQTNLSCSTSTGEAIPCCGNCGGSED